MNLDYIKQRLWEQHEYFSILKASSDKDLEDGKELINKIKSSETSKEDRKVLFNNNSSCIDRNNINRANNKISQACNSLALKLTNFNNRL